MKTITVQQLHQLIQSNQECALVDVREQGSYSSGHLLFAICIPLSRLDLLIADLVPRKLTPIVLMDRPEEESFAERAGECLEAIGYENVRILSGGVGAWHDHGLELFTGINVPSKAFGEFIEHVYDTPRLAASEVQERLEAGEDMVIVDSRPFAEFQRMNIPTGTDMPGAELVYRIHDLAPDPQTLIVVNCAGRTRSIIGAQSLINAGLPNPVVALKDGTMGWHLSGFELEHGTDRVAPVPSRTGLAKAQASAAKVRRRFGVSGVNQAHVEHWLKDPQRSTFCLDVRSPEEYAVSHVAGYRNAPGGQLVQATDEYVGVRNARIVLADEAGVRATMTASWLLQMGWREVYVLEDDYACLPQNSGSPSGAWSSAWTDDKIDGLPPAALTTDVLASALRQVTVVDLGPSPAYEVEHIPGAVWCTRARLAGWLADQSGQRVVLTSPDGRLARVALSDTYAPGLQIDALDGGTEKWIAEGRETSTGLERTVSPTDDVWFKPYDHRGEQEKFMREYLTWEVALVDQIARDGTTKFRAF